MSNTHRQEISTAITEAVMECLHKLDYMPVCLDCMIDVVVRFEEKEHDNACREGCEDCK